MSQRDPPLTVTALADGAVVADIRTSLRVPLPGMGQEQVGVTLILYAAAPGTFVDLAADLAWLTAQTLTEFAFDEHLTLPDGPDTAAQLQAACEINQAIGVLIGRGHTPEHADRQLDIRAADDRTDRHRAAQRILGEITTAHGDT